MHNVRNITENLYWIGANDRRLALFENIHPILKECHITHICY